MRVDHDLVLAVQRIRMWRGKLMLLLNNLPMQLRLLGRLQHAAHDHLLHKLVTHLIGALAHLKLGLMLGRRLTNHRRAGLPMLVGRDDWDLLTLLVLLRVYLGG